MGSFDNWIAALQLFQDGRIWYNNYEFDRRSGNMPTEALQEFVTAFDKISFSVESSDSSWDVAQKVARIFDEIIGVKTRFLHLKGTRIPKGCSEFSRVMTFKAFVDNHVDRHRIGIPIDEWDDNIVWDAFETIITPRYFKGSLRTTHIFFWCTKTSNISALRKHCGPLTSEFAVEARNQLGLAYFEQSFRLVEVIIPQNAIAAKVVVAPTCFDAGLPNRVWVPTIDVDGFGRALNLLTCQRGLEEAVVQELTFNEEFTVIRIGVIPDIPLPQPSLDLLEEESINRLAGL